MKRSLCAVLAWAMAGIAIPVAYAQSIPQDLTPRNADAPTDSRQIIEVLDLLPTEPESDEDLPIDENAPAVPAVEVPPITDPNAPVDLNAIQEPIRYNGVVLTGINKIPARSEEISGAIGTILRFNNLEIIAHRCQSIVDNGAAGFAALLEIWEFKAGDTPQKILQGWMFSTSPSLFSLEHPLYDISLKKCTTIDVEVDAPKEDKKESKDTKDSKDSKDKKATEATKTKDKKATKSEKKSDTKPSSSSTRQPVGNNAKP